MSGTPRFVLVLNATRQSIILAFADNFVHLEIASRVIIRALRANQPERNGQMRESTSEGETGGFIERYRIKKCHIY
jgi:hypothetical protein